MNEPDESTDVVICDAVIDIIRAGDPVAFTVALNDGFRAPAFTLRAIGGSVRVHDFRQDFVGDYPTILQAYWAGARHRLALIEAVEA
ncbi:hypothetical protein [Lichenifustis flavocetrariae]|uniref:Uncharacterized protein n=1 Tax=Lichenifustis flavocetrariae TaxID=2949735 RepID=A0AA41ZC11_9HYPH|nr:hypothetical protein [Lichenifustis flavocetrariae]MCW6513107.1 hypothetical protein [Lichenifustis flavocetrariae]